MRDPLPQQISVDCSPVADAVDELLLLLERLPKRVANALVQRALDLVARF